MVDWFIAWIAGDNRFKWFNGFDGFKRFNGGCGAKNNEAPRSINRAMPEDFLTAGFPLGVS